MTIRITDADKGAVFEGPKGTLWKFLTRTTECGWLYDDAWVTIGRWPGPGDAEKLTVNTDGTLRSAAGGSNPLIYGKRTGEKFIERKLGTQASILAAIEKEVTPPKETEKVVTIHGFKKGDWVGSTRSGSPYQITKIKCTNEWDRTHGHAVTTGFVHLKHPDRSAVLVQTSNEFAEHDWVSVPAPEPTTGWINIYVYYRGKVSSGHTSPIYDTREQARAAARTDYGRFPPSYKDTIQISWKKD